MLLDRTGQPASLAWARVADDASVPDDRPAIVSLSRLRGLDPAVIAARRSPLGVRLSSHEGPETIAQHLDLVALVAIEFPKFRDGRGFTTARALRERFAFAGEILAFGHILPDQYAFLVRCGFTLVDLREGQDPQVWRRSLESVRVVYQRAADDATSLSLLRRRFTAGGAV